MVEMSRHCPDCGQRRTFEQPHPHDGECPDSPDGYCPEWLCADCGAALLTDFAPYLPEPAAAGHLHRRVA